MIEETTMQDRLRKKLYDRCANFHSFKKIKGYPKIKYHDFGDRRIYFIEVSKTKRLQELGYGFKYNDVLIGVTKKKTFFGKIKDKEFFQECKNIETNLPKLLKDIMFYQKNEERIIPTIEVKQGEQNCIERA